MRLGDLAVVPSATDAVRDGSGGRFSLARTRNRWHPGPLRTLFGELRDAR